MSFERKIWTPALVFSAHDSELRLREAKIRTAKIISALASAPKWILGNVGVPMIFGESIAFLIRFSVDVEGAQKRFIEAKIEESVVSSAISMYQAKMRGVQGRLDRLLRDISRKERELELVPAFMACQETLALFQDDKYPFWIKPEISTPLFVSFAGIYVAVCKMTVELIESYRSDAEKEMKILGDLVDDYRRRFLCFRLYQPKYPTFSSKGIVDKYDENFRTTTRYTTSKTYDCFCLHKQDYSSLLSDVYGSFFDSVKAAIIDSELLPPGETLKHEWCTEHHRCNLALEIQKNCFCKNWSFDESYLQGKDEEVEEAIAARECLLSVASTDTYVRHYQYTCKTCEFEENICICHSCILICHQGHDIEFLRYGWFICNCADSKSNTKCELVKEEIGSSESDLEQEIIKNSDGVAVIKGRSGFSGGVTGLKASELYYCGREMQQCRCGTCDGFCGPINGCPCDSCREIVFPDPKKYVWPSAVCDECEEVIVGERYKCEDCKDYNLCHGCISEEIHISHDFIRMMKALKDVEVSDVHRYVECDGCSEHPLCGKRYKCTECVDYDLCSSCYDKKDHDHDEFKIISTSERNWVIDAMKEARLSNSDCDSDEDLDLDVRSHSENIKKACILFERDPEIPFSRELDLEENTAFYALNINGRIPRKPHRFEVNIGFEDKKIFHLNQRWDQQKTVLNTFDDEWGRKEFTFFGSLVPKSKFNLEIVFKDGCFEMRMNDEDPVYFARRIMDESLKLLVEVKGDIIPKLITFDLHNFV